MAGEARTQVAWPLRAGGAHARRLRQGDHGLVFRHFGNKDQLVSAVLNHQAAQLAHLLDAEAPLTEIATAGTRQLRVPTRTLLDGSPVDHLQTSFPAADRLLDQIRPRHETEESARLATAHAIALLLGWQLFEPFLRTAIGLPDLTKKQLRQAIFTERAALSQPH